MPDTHSKLEQRVIKNEALGQVWVKAHATAMLLEETKKSVLASIKNDMEKTSQGKYSELKLQRLSEGSKQYDEHIKGMCVAKTEALSAKVKYDSGRELFEALRSAQAFSREKMKYLPEKT